MIHELFFNIYIIKDIMDILSKKRIVINSESKLSLEEVLELIKHNLNTKETIIISDPNIALNNEYRKQIHTICDNSFISSETIRPMGSPGLFVVVSYDSSIVHNGLTKNDLTTFIRMCALPIDKRILVSSDIFKYKMSVIEKFHSKHGKSDALPPNELLEMFKKAYVVARERMISLNDLIADISYRVLQYITNCYAYKNFINEPRACH